MNRPTKSDASQWSYGYLRQKNLLAIVPFSAATLWRMVKAGTFIRPVKFSARVTAWNKAEVLAWLQEREGKVQK